MQNKIDAVNPTWTSLLLRLVDILCDRKLRASVSVVQYVSRPYFPIAKSLEICERKQHVEACAVLYKRKGDYK
jgi:hypothetical protein